MKQSVFIEKSTKRKGKQNRNNSDYNMFITMDTSLSNLTPNQESQKDQFWVHFYSMSSSVT